MTTKSTPNQTKSSTKTYLKSFQDVNPTGFFVVTFLILLLWGVTDWLGRH